MIEEHAQPSLEAFDLESWPHKEMLYRFLAGLEIGIAISEPAAEN